MLQLGKCAWSQSDHIKQCNMSKFWLIRILLDPGLGSAPTLGVCAWSSSCSSSSASSCSRSFTSLSFPSGGIIITVQETTGLEDLEVTADLEDLGGPEGLEGMEDRGDTEEDIRLITHLSLDNISSANDITFFTQNFHKIFFFKNPLQVTFACLMK